VKKSPPETDAAINELVDLKKTAPRNMQVRLLLAELYDKTGRRNLAIQDLDDALQKAPGNRDLRLALVRLYRSERPPQVGPAMALIAKAENDPVLKTDAAWPREAALLFMQQRQYQPAVMRMTRAVQLAPGNTDFRRELVDMLLQFNDLDGALFETEKLMRDGHDAWWLRQQRGVAYGKQVTRQMLADAKAKPEAAKQLADLQARSLSEFDRAIALAEKDGDEDRVASLLRLLGQTVGNDHALKRVAPRTANDPANRWRMLAIGLKRAQGDVAGAVADAERLLADPANAAANPDRRGPILRALADTYQNQARPDLAKARQRYEELLKLVPNDIVSLNNIAYLLAESVQPPDPHAAKAYSERAYELTRTSNDPSALIMDTHAWVLVLCGGDDLNRGVQILKTVVEKNPLFVEGRYHLAEALMRTRPATPAQAVAEFTECMRILDEEEKVGGTVDEKLRGRVQLGLSKAQELAKGG
jgi:Tfp pilus assembly protein PilF